MWSAGIGAAPGRVRATTCATCSWPTASRRGASWASRPRHSSRDALTAYLGYRHPHAPARGGGGDGVSARARRSCPWRPRAPSAARSRASAGRGHRTRRDGLRRGHARAVAGGRRGLTWENLAAPRARSTSPGTRRRSTSSATTRSSRETIRPLLRVPVHDLVARGGAREWSTSRSGAGAHRRQPLGRAAVGRRHDQPRRPPRAPARAASAACWPSTCSRCCPSWPRCSRRAGAVRANQENGERLLRKGELVGVFPEGVKGVGKPFKDRYQPGPLRPRRVRAAAPCAPGAPIVPCAVVGAEEIHPDDRAGWTGWAGRWACPTCPITPTFPLLGPLGVVPLPTKWSIDFADPDPDGRVRPGGRGGPDPGQPPVRAGPLDRPAHGRQPARAPALGLVRLSLPSQEAVMSKTHALGAALVLTAAATAASLPAAPPPAPPSSRTRRPRGPGSCARRRRRAGPQAVKDVVRTGAGPPTTRDRACGRRIPTRRARSRSCPVADFPTRCSAVNGRSPRPSAALSTQDARGPARRQRLQPQPASRTSVTPATPGGAHRARARPCAAIRCPSCVTASRRADTLRYVGDDVVDGEKNDVITFADADGTQITLYVGARTRAPHQIRDDRRQPGAGRHGDRDEALRLPAGGRRAVALPRGDARGRPGHAGREVLRRQGQRRAGGHPVRAAGGAPQVTPAARAGDGRRRRRSRTTCFSLAGSSHNSLLVTFPDHSLLVEAPLSDDRTQARDGEDQGDRARQARALRGDDPLPLRPLRRPARLDRPGRHHRHHRRQQGVRGAGGGG